MRSEDFASGELGDGDVVVGGEREDSFAGVFDAGVEVMHAACPADRHLAFAVEPVVAEPVVTGRVSVASWGGCRGGAVGLAGCASLQSSVRALFVVVLTELVELALQFGCGLGLRSGSQPALEGLVEALGLALGLWVSRRPVLLPDAEQRQNVFERVATAGEAARVDASVSVSVLAGRIPRSGLGKRSPPHRPSPAHGRCRTAGSGSDHRAS